MIVDPISAIVSFLKANSNITTLVSMRVFGVELPLIEASSMPRKAVVIQPAGGGIFPVGSKDFIEHSDARIDAFCYGETPFEAEKVRREVYDVFKQLRRKNQGGSLIHWINSAGGGLTLRDPDTKWPIAFQSFQAFFSERLIA